MADTSVTLAVWMKDGDCLEVGEDRDGLGLMEIRYRDPQGKIGDGVLVPESLIGDLRRAITIWEDTAARIANEKGASK